jgi:spore coat protein U-like protein
MFKKVAFIAVAASALASNGAFAATATTPMNVSATITGSCTVSATALAFGSIVLTDANRDTTADLTVNCTSTVPYEITINGTTGGRAMSFGISSLNYEVYTDAARTTGWANTSGPGTVTGTGSGANQTVTVYGRVPVQSTPPAGAYTDTRTVTVSY